jgi:hypothetical protein
MTRLEGAGWSTGSDVEGFLQLGAVFKDNTPHAARERSFNMRFISL